MGAQHRRDGSGLLAAVVYVLCAVYLHAVSSLFAWTALPVLGGLTPTLIVSDSMTPSISAGDLVLTGASDANDLSAGQVITFEDPARPQRLLTHRIAGVNDDGTYRTRGDANRDDDSTQVPPDAVRGVGRLVVPVLGIPVIWVRSGLWLPIVLWMLGTAVAVAYLALYGRVRPGLWGWTSRLGDAQPPVPAQRSGRPQRRTWEAPVPSRRPRWVIPTTIVVLVLVAASVPRVTSSHAAWSGGAVNQGNTWEASAQFCSTGTRTLYATADARIADGSVTPQGGQTTIGVANKGPVTKSVVTFDLSSLSVCDITSATLRLRVVTGATGRTLHAWRVAAPWDEASVVWPGPATTTDVPGVASSSATVGAWVTFDVTSHARAIRAGTAHGLLVQDSSTTGAGAIQTYNSREAATGKPELVLQVAPKPPPAAPTGLAATAESSTRVGLTWTDASGGTAGFRVERSAGGAGSWATIGTVAAGTTTYTDAGLQPSSTYDYRVRATASSGVSTASNVASATTPAAPAAPAAPTSPAAAATGVNTVAVTWTDASTDEDGFTVERSPAGAGTWTDVGSVGPNVTSFGDTGLTAGTAYDYRVRAYNGGGTSSWSNVATVTTDGCSTLPAQTLLSEADALILEGATYGGTNFGADAVNFGVRSQTGGNGRSLVRFPAPTVAAGCSVATANLRLRTTTATTGRTLQVFKADASWTEGGVTWNTQPTSSGTAATVLTDAVLGWRQWDVTGLVGAAGAGAPHGFLLRDANEGEAIANDNVFSPKEGTYRPELVITFAAP